MKTIYKIQIAKILSRILTFFISRNQNVERNSIKWSLDLNEGIDLSIYLFGTSEKKIVNFFVNEFKNLKSKQFDMLLIVQILALLPKLLLEIFC